MANRLLNAALQSIEGFSRPSLGLGHSFNPSPQLFRMVRQRNGLMSLKESADFQSQRNAKTSWLLIARRSGFAATDHRLRQCEFLSKLPEGVRSLGMPAAVVIPARSEGNHHPFNLGQSAQPAEQRDQVAFTDGVSPHHPRGVGAEIAADGKTFDELGVPRIEVALLVSDEANHLEFPPTPVQLIGKPLAM